MGALKTRLSRLEARTSTRREPRILIYECPVDWPPADAEAFVADQLGEDTAPRLVVRLDRYGLDGPPRIVSSRP